MAINDPYAFNAPQYDISLLKKAGEDVFVSSNVEIRRPSLVSLGSHVAIDSGFYGTTSLETGNHVHIGAQVCVIGGARGKLKIGHFCTLAVGTRIVCASDTYSGDFLVSAPGVPDDFVKVVAEPVVIEDFVGIGANATVLPGVKLAEGTVIGAGSVVLKSTEPWTIYAGVPARPIKKREMGRMKEFAAKLGYPFKA